MDDIRFPGFAHLVFVCFCRSLIGFLYERNVIGGVVFLHMGN